MNVTNTPLGGPLTVSATNNCGTVFGSSDVIPMPEFPWPGKNQPYITLLNALCISNIFTGQVVAVPNATSYSWRVRELNATGGTVFLSPWFNSTTNQATYSCSGFPATRSAIVYVYATTPCGVTNTINRTFSNCKFARMANTEETISVNPNPTKGITRISLPTEFGQNGTYELSSSHTGLVLKGRIVKSKNYFEIDLTKFSNGIYTLLLTDNKITRQVKIIKE